MISQTAEYALRAVSFLAEHPGASQTTRQTAEATAVPADYLSKVFTELTRAGLVRSQRGLYGGYQLAGDPAQLLVWDVIQSVSPPKRYHQCPRGRTHVHGTLCPLHALLEETNALIEAAFRSVTIADLLDDSEGEHRRCDGRTDRTRLQIDRNNGRR